jgi:protein-tyrosine-phosphatase
MPPERAEVPEVLFVCVHNAGRSQMAASLLDWRSQGRVRVRSAGSAPANEINPAVVDAMEELGLDLSQEFPKPLTDAAVRAADVVITMGCGDACPFFPGKRYLDWELDDPAGQSLATVRRIRDAIDARVQRLLAELSVADPEVPIACTLDATAMPERLDDWQAVLAHVTERTTATDGALRLEFDDEIGASELARLAAAEQHCCSFFSFVITVDARGVGLEVRAPGEATEIVSALFGR